MAIYHCSVKIIGRSSGRSSVAASAYRSGEKLHNEHDGTTHDYTRRSGVAYSEIILPSHTPSEYSDRSILWNAVEQSERRKDARTAREVELALPIEFDLTEQIELVREYIAENFTSKGMCADVSIHNKGDGNPHAHIMLTTREVLRDGFGNKNREWDKVEQLETWRENWANICNKRFQEKGLDERIDHRTLEAQGIDREPTIHLGVAAPHMEQRGIRSERGDINRKIMNEKLQSKLSPEELRAKINRIRQAESYIKGYTVAIEELSKNGANSPEIEHLKELIEQQRNNLVQEGISPDKSGEDLTRLSQELEEIQMRALNSFVARDIGWGHDNERER